MKGIGVLALLFTASAFAGILPASRGGTGANNTPVAGGAIYSTSSGFGVTSAGTSGAVLQSNGTSAPTFVNSILLPTGGTLVMPAGGSLVNTAPIYIRAGTSLTTKVSGAIESNGTHLFWTNSSGTRIQLDN